MYDKEAVVLVAEGFAYWREKGYHPRCWETVLLGIVAVGHWPLLPSSEAVVIAAGGCTCCTSRRPLLLLLKDVIVGEERRLPSLFPGGCACRC